MSNPSDNSIPSTPLAALDHLAFTRDLVEVAYMAAASLADRAEVGAFQTPLAIAIDRIASLKAYLEAEAVAAVQMEEARDKPCGRTAGKAVQS